MRRFLSVGECMVELRSEAEGVLRKGFAGDTFNMAYYARAALPADWQVDYLTAVGTDHISDEMLAFMAAQGIGTDLVIRRDDRTAGLYMIHLDNGERSFSYWRSASAARLLAADRAVLARAMAGADIVGFSGISLAVLEGDGARTLTEEAARHRAAGGTVAFDPNIRPRLWSDAETMRRVVTEGARAASILLPSFDDEATHFGDATPAATIARYRALGVERIVVKMGPEGALIHWDGTETAVPATPATVVDTTSAGDSFNGTFLAHLALTEDPVRAAAEAARVAAAVVGHPGALVPPALLGKPVAA